MVQTEQQIFAINILLNIFRSKGKQEISFDQLIKFNYNAPIAKCINT